MKKINVLGKYDIAIGERLIERAGMAIKRVCKGKKCTVVSDSNVAPLYAELIRLPVVVKSVKTFKPKLAPTHAPCHSVRA